MRKLNIIILSIVSSLALNAAEVPNISDALKQVTPPTIQRDKPQIPVIQLQEKDTPKEFQDGRKAKIEEFVISGAVNIDIAKLKKLVAPYEHKELSFKEIQDVTTLITKEYRNQGYFVARAYLPAQDILEQNNNLKINIIEGNYGEFVLENNSLVKDSTLQGNLDSIKEANIISTNILERAMLIINDTSGVVVSKAEVRPGEVVGTSDFIIGAEATKRYGGYIIGDNYGSQYTGKHRIMGGVDIASPFGIGDKLSLFALTSEKEGLLNGRISYDFPLHANGTRGQISYSKTTYELGSTYKNLDAIGDSQSINARVSYPVIRTRVENLKSYVEFSHNDMKDEIKSVSLKTKKDSYVATAGLDYTKDDVLWNKNSQTRASVSLSLGHLNFKDEVDKRNDKAGANTQGRFSKINIELGKDIDLNKDIKWENSLQIQYAFGGKNLDGSQDLSVGGINGVKFYPDGEASAENGYIYNTELFYTLPSVGRFSTKISAFYDVGRVSMSRNITNESPRTLQDVGVGFNGSYGDFFINTHLAYNIANEVTSEKQYNSRFLVQVGWVF